MKLFQGSLSRERRLVCGGLLFSVASAFTLSCGIAVNTDNSNFEPPATGEGGTWTGVGGSLGGDGDTIGGESGDGDSQKPTPALCPVGKWDDDADAASPCVEHSKCEDDEYESIAPTATSDRKCSRISVCSSDQELLEPASDTSDVVCRECTPSEPCDDSGSQCPTGVAIPARGKRPSLCTSHVATLSAGWSHTCALDQTGSVYCWGSNEYGALGAVTTNLINPTPLRVEGLNGKTAVEVSTGYYHSCVTLSDGTIRCWGRNNENQLGDGTSYDQNSAANVPGFGEGKKFGRAISVSAGAENTCALSESGAVTCWGFNEFGELGDETGFPSSAPRLIDGIDGKTVATTAVHVTAGSTPCVILGNGALKCWGANRRGQLGTGSQREYDHQLSTVTIFDGSTKARSAVHVSAADESVCALAGDGRVHCWGSNSSGQLGVPVASESSPQEVSGLDPSKPDAGAQFVSTGGWSTCALLPDNAVSCWGHAASGLLGSVSTDPQIAPLKIEEFDGLSTASAVSELSVGGFHACVRLQNGEIRCWGSNAMGQVGGDRVGFFETPVGLGTEGVVGVSGGNSHLCEVLSTGEVKCRGSYDESVDLETQLPRLIPGFDGLSENTTAIEVASYLDHACARTLDGAVKCWGLLYQDELWSSDVPVPWPGLDGTSPSSSSQQLIIGSVHSCSVLETGAVACWGDNSFGQLGVEPGAEPSSLVQVTLLDGATDATTASSVTVGDRHSCAVLKSGAVVCWGDNLDQQFGDGSSTSSFSPQQVMGLDGTTPSTSAMSLAAASDHTCAVLVDSTVKCWGELQNSNSNNTPAEFGTPWAVSGIDGLTPPTSAVEIKSVSTSVCARFGDGSIKCWGSKTATVGSEPNSEKWEPVVVPGFDGLSSETKATSLTLGWTFGCALLNTGTAHCWGSNHSGQILGMPIYTSSELVVF